MNKRTASLVLVVIALLASFVTLNQSAAAQARGKRDSIVRQQKAPVAPPTNIGFLSATQIPAGGGTYSQFPAVMGDFNGDGKQDVATMVNTGSNAKPTLAISVILSNGDGTFSSAKTTATAYTSVVFNPMWAGNLNGVDDIVVGVQATATTPASIDVYLSNGDGTFKPPVNYPVTNTNDVMVWGTLTKDSGTGFLDFVAADGASPNGSVWTLTGKGDGTFNAATSVAFTGALQPGDPVLANSFNPMVFADFDGNGTLDFAAPVLTTNQVAVYLNSGTAYTSTLLATPNHVYHSCYLATGILKSGLDLVAPNCFDNTVTVWVNNGSGGFGAGTYYTAGTVPSAVTIADIDGDGNNDVVSSNWQGADVTVLLGNGTGALSAPGPAFAIGGSAHINSPLTPALVADFNGDGHLDAVLQDSEFSFVYLQNLGNPPSTPPSFRSVIDYQFPVLDLSYSVAIASGDFITGHTTPGFVVGSANSKNPTTPGVTVFLSNPDGTLQPGVSYAGSGSLTNPQFQYVAVADFDGDGNLDIAATDSVNGVVQIFAGKGDGTFTAGPTFPTGTGVSALGIAVGDFNGDKKPDLAVVNNAGTTSNNVAILTNGSTPGSFVFTAAQLPNLSTLGATEITAADLNNDGKIDLVVPMWGVTGTPGTSVALFLGKGDGTFNAESDFNLGFNNPYYATVGDFNGDGKVDLAVTTQDQTNAHNQGIAIALGNGAGTFQTASLVFTTLQNFALDEPFPGYVKAVDLNRDGKLDLIYTNKKYGTVGILYGQGTGAFYDPVEFAAGAKAYDIIVADVNGDGALDVVASSNAVDFVGATVLLNTSADTTVQNPPSATNVSRGTPVTFSANVTGSTVKGVTAVPTGSVSFIDNGGNNLGSGMLDSGGLATVISASLETGSNSVVAQYSGDANYLASTSAAQAVQVSGQTGSATMVTSSANPAALGQSVTFTATVASTLKGDTLVPTGTVTFKDGTTVLGPGTIAKGVATLVTSTLTAGTHSITGTYGGDASFTGSTSTPPLNQVVSGAPDYMLTATPTSLSVNPGSAATFTIKVAAVNGYNGVVSFSASSCTGLPAESSCSFSSATVTGSGTTTLTISTTGPTAVLRAPADVNHHSGGLNLWASLGGVGVLGMILASEGKKRNRRRVGIVLTILAVVMLIALVGCGGGSSGGGGGGGGTGGTPAGTSTVQLNVTGTVNTAAHHLTTPITLTVN